MSGPDDPYRTPTSIITATGPAEPRQGQRPLALWMLLICYAWYCLLESAYLLAFLPRERPEAIAMIANVLYAIGVGIGLWRGVNWVRIGVVLTTVGVLLLLAFMGSRGILEDNPVMVVACLLRVAAAAMLFLPSVRHRFTTRQA